MTDVARAAGVSLSTASEVLAGRDRGWIGAETRERVLKTARKLQYSPNIIARSLRSQSSKTLGLIFPGMVNEYVVQTAEAIYDAADREGYKVLLTPLRSDDPAVQLGTIADLGSRMVEGIFILSPYREWSAGNRIPLISTVLVDTIATDGSSGSVGQVRVDRSIGVEQAVSTLLSMGRRRVLVVLDLQNARDGRARTGPEKLAGCRRAHERAGLALSDDLIFRVPLRDAWSVDEGVLVGRRIILEGTKFDALFANNDQLAIGIMEALIESGRNVPGDVAVVGFADQPACLISRVRLSSVRVPIDQLAQAAIAQMLKLRSADELPGNLETVIPSEFVPRQSVHAL
jgi:LacI family transcriptional regulator